jgi:NAD(P)H-hydrate repair Nnr-like enzyme with NAD(P)H-hydrate dehydratase domain
MSLIWADGFDHYGAQSEVAKEYSGAFTFNSGASARTGLGYVSLDVYYNRMQRVLNTNIPALALALAST